MPALILSESQIELLKLVKARMLVDVEVGREAKRAYICWNAALIDLGLEWFPREMLFERLLERTSADVRALISAIESVLVSDEDECYTFSNWLDNAAFFCDLNIKLTDAYALGRLAWLDKMIETGEVN
jgi:hypothetical protein